MSAVSQLARNTRTRAGLATGVLALTLCLTGCERDTPASAALRQANEKLLALTPDGSNTPSLPFRNKVYAEVVTLLKPVADRGTSGETAAAYLLIAQAQNGTAEVPASEAALNERLALNEIQAVRSALGQYLSFAGLAEAAAKFDPTAELAGIETEIKDRTDRRVAEQQRKAAIDAQVAEILGKAKAKGDEAKARRQESGSLKSQVANQSATQGEATLRQAQEISRIADALEVEAATLEAQAAQIAPQSVEIQLQIDRLTSQKELLEKARGEVQKRTQTNKTNAADARAKAAEAAETLKKALAALDERRTTAVTTASEQAIAAYRAAVASAQKAAGEARGPAHMSIGNAQQSLGDIYWSQAHGLSAYAEMLGSLAAATPALPDSAKYKEAAAAATAAAKTALEQATEAYEAANNAYKTGGGAGIEDRLRRINARLADIVKATSGGAKDIRDTEAPKEETPAPTDQGAPSAAIEPGTPQATIQALIDMDKTGDFSSAGDLFSASTPEEKQALVAILGLTPKFKKLGEAMKAKFGKGLEEAGGAAGVDMGMQGLSAINAADLPVKIEGDTATAQLPNGKPMKLVKKGDAWLFDMSSAGVTTEQLQMVRAMVPMMSKAVDELIPEIEAGKYSDAQAVLQALGQKMMGGAGGNR